MRDEKIWYQCDPGKNIECNKRSCKNNPNAKYRVCDRTIHKEYAIDGALPLVRERTNG